MKGTKRRVNGTRRKKGAGRAKKKTGRLLGEQGVQSTIANQQTIAIDNLRRRLFLLSFTFQARLESSVVVVLR